MRIFKNGKTLRDCETDDEYFVEDANGKIQKGWISTMYPNRDCNYILYLLRNKRGIIQGWRDSYGGFSMSDMYDNKQDCIERAHEGCDDWDEWQ